MKHVFAVILVLALMLTACGTQAPEKGTETTNAAESLQETQTNSPAADAGETTVPAASDMELAKSCLNKPVEELYELIGEPASSEYISSCMGDGEDGNLYYDGFTVFTYREGDSETVQFVE